MRATAVLVMLVLALCACGSAAPDGSNVPPRTSPARASSAASATSATSATSAASAISATPATQATSGQRATPDLATANGGRPAHVRFTPLTVADPAAENTGAFALLVPDGWQAQGSVQWMPDWERLAFLQTTVTDPSTGITIEWLPIQDFIWFDAPAGFNAPIGGNYQGKAYVPPITDPAQFVSGFWGSSSLAHLQGVNATRVDQIPAVADEFKKQFGGPGEAFDYRMRYEYQQQGQPWQEDVSFALLFSQANGITSWYVNFAFAVRAPRGQLDANAGIISTVIASRNTTPHWEAIYRLVQQQFIQGIRQQMADTEAFGRALAQYRAETQALQDQVTQERQASQDRIAELRGESLQGIQTYTDPVNQTLVQLPVGWSSYWVNQQGEYIATDPGFDPNAFAGGGWQQLQPQPF